MKIEVSTSGSSPSQKTSVSVKRWRRACIYYRKPYSNQKTWKRMKKSWFLEEMWPEASPETFSVTRECYLGHFWWKIFPSIFQHLFWTIIFAWFNQNFQWFPQVIAILSWWIRIQLSSLLLKSMKFSSECTKKYVSKYDLENRWKYFSSEMS